MRGQGSRCACVVRVCKEGPQHAAPEVTKPSRAIFGEEAARLRWHGALLCGLESERS